MVQPRKRAWVVFGIIGLVAVCAGLFLMYTPARERVAVIYVEGVITGGRAQSSIFGGSGGTDEVIRQIRSAREDKEVKAIVIRINSPGGSAPASQEVGEEVKRLKTSGKPVIASMGDIAASGGYWIAALTDKIYANAGTITGSIGVYIPYTNWEELYKKIGLHSEKIKSGPHKDMLSPERPMTGEERQIIQTMVDDLYDQFVTVVSEGRKLDPAQVRKLADGRVYTGRQAKQLGLIDEIGTFYDAIDQAAKQAGIKGKPDLKEYGRGGLWDAIWGADDRSFADGIRRSILQQVTGQLFLLSPERFEQR